MFSSFNHQLNKQLFELTEYNSYSFDEIEKKKSVIDFFLDMSGDKRKSQYLDYILKFLGETQSFLAATNVREPFISHAKKNTKVFLYDFELMNSKLDLFINITSQNNIQDEHQFMVTVINYVIEAIKTRIQTLNELLGLKSMPGWQDAPLIKKIQNYPKLDMNPAKNSEF